MILMTKTKLALVKNCLKMCKDHKDLYVSDVVVTHLGEMIDQVNYLQTLTDGLTQPQLLESLQVASMLCKHGAEHKLDRRRAADTINNLVKSVRKTQHERNILIEMVEIKEKGTTSGRLFKLWLRSIFR